MKQIFKYQGKEISKVLILGLGLTGKSVVDFFSDYEAALQIYDDREIAYQGIQSDDDIAAFDLENQLVVASPGFNLSDPKFQSLINLNVPIVSDIEIFASMAVAPIIAVTGSNGKSTVVSLLGEVLNLAGYQTKVVGNIGKPVLSSLSDEVEYYVLELSSFQLEHTYHLNAKVGCILNVSPDHIDQHGSFEAYQNAKLRLVNQCDFLLLNNKDSFSAKLLEESNFIEGINDPLGYHLGTNLNELKFNGQTILDVEGCYLKGSHNFENILFVLAITTKLEISRELAIEAIKSFKGLPHRCQQVAEIQGVKYINDSKGTNIGATIAAVEGLAKGKNVILILGGLTKGADFADLLPVIQKYVIKIFVYGQDREVIRAMLKGVSGLSLIETMGEAVENAYAVAKAGNLVLFSPACSSFDQFDGYAQRGEIFIKTVQNLNKN
mgnify:CR=1 FL=1